MVLYTTKKRFILTVTSFVFLLLSLSLVMATPQLARASSLKWNATMDGGKGTIPSFSQFVGKWFAHSHLLVIYSDGSADYAGGRAFVWCKDVGNQQPCDTEGLAGEPINTKIMFDDVKGDTAYGKIIAGTGLRHGAGSRAVIPVGSSI